MKEHWFLRIMVLFLFLAITGTLSSAAAPQQPSATKETASPAQGCLKCHGPFEKLASAPPRFIAPSGEKITPHRYVPHDLKDIPDCVSCHQAHSANPTAAEIAALPKPNVKTCYECHHKENFTLCKACHK
jgi:hypothetical protein